MTNTTTGYSIESPGHDYHHVIRRGEAWELSIISNPRVNGGHTGLFEVAIVHNHNDYPLGRKVEIIASWQNYAEVGVFVEWFRDSSIPQIQERFNSYEE